MAGTSLNFELEDGDRVTMTLSDSARISLTDITAATIGNLSEESQWGDNSTIAAYQNVPVLRPWEDNSGTDKSTEDIPQNVVYADRQPPTYKEHLKRRLEDDETKETEDLTKRIKLESANLTNTAGVLYSYPIQGLNSQSLAQHNSLDTSQIVNTHTSGHYSPQTFMPFGNIQNFQQNVSTQKSLQNVTTQNSILNAVNQNSMLNASTQNAIQRVGTQNSMLSVPTQNSMLSVPTQNSMLSVPTQNSMIQYQAINQQHSSLTLEQSPSFSQSSNKNYLPWIDSQVISENKTIQNAKQETYSREYKQQTPVQSNKLIIDEGVSTTNTKLYPPKPELVQSVPTQFLMPSLHSVPEYWQTSTIPSQQKHEKQPSTGEMRQSQHPNFSSLPPLQPAPKYLQMSDILQNKSVSEEYKPMLSPWQHTINSYHPDDIQPKASTEVKQVPGTPISKRLMAGSNFDSPGIESRFTESLSNLLGSPPPDSPLSKNPILGDLQALLNRECKREIVPQSLFGMQGTNKQTVEKKTLNVFERERNLQERFTNLQSSHAEDVRQLSSMFRYQSALIETERFRTLHECQYPGSYKESVNHHYDNQLHKVMDRVERSVELLENSNKENRANKVTKLRPHLSKESVRLMEQWYHQNLNHPYPTNSSIEMLAQAGNIGIEQVKKWFANKRNRSSNTRSLTEIAMQKRKLGQMPGKY